MANHETHSVSLRTTAYELARCYNVRHGINGIALNNEFEVRQAVGLLIRLLGLNEMIECTEASRSIVGRSTELTYMVSSTSANLDYRRFADAVALLQSNINDPPSGYKF